jgi:DNA-binding CsgD family transcriptional regulator
MPPALGHGGPSRFEALLARLSATFTHLPPEQVDGQIENALAQVVDFLDIERSSLAQFSADGNQLIVTHSYTIVGFPPMPRVDLAAMWPWYTAQVRAGRVLRMARVPEGVPPEAVAEQEAYRRGGLPLSHLMVPFHVGGAVLGGIGFASFRREVDWGDGLAARLQLMGEVFANALARQVAQEKESQLREQLARQEAALGREAAVEEVRRREATLSPREREVFALVASGLPNKRSAARLGVCEKTIKAHRGQVMRKMQAESLAELVRMAARLGVVPEG